MLKYDQIISGLKVEVNNGNIKEIINSDGRILYDYTRECQFNKNWNYFTKIARGLVVDSNNKIIFWNLPKFLNYSELEYKAPNGVFLVQEKIDGSLGLAHYFNGRWYISTRGSFTSDQSLWATEWLHKYGPINNLNPNFTYIFEIIFPSNKIVVDYKGWEGLYLLTIFDIISGKELSIEYTSSIFRYFDSTKFKLPKIYNYSSLEECCQIVDTFDHNQEGFVVRYLSDNYRIKIKGKQYLRIHKIKDRITPLGVWELMYSGDSIQDVRKLLPEELLSDFDVIHNKILLKEISELEKASNWVLDNLLLDKKEFAIALQAVDVDFNKSTAFMLFNGKSSHEVKKKILWSLRPTGNIL